MISTCFPTTLLKRNEMRAALQNQQKLQIRCKKSFQFPRRNAFQTFYCLHYLASQYRWKSSLFFHLVAKFYFYGWINYFYEPVEPHRGTLVRGACALGVHVLWPAFVPSFLRTRKLKEFANIIWTILCCSPPNSPKVFESENRAHLHRLMPKCGFEEWNGWLKPMVDGSGSK